MTRKEESIMPEYCIPVRVTGKVELHLTADSPEDAKEMADEAVSDTDFGDLEDIEWNVKDPIIE